MNRTKKVISLMLAVVMCLGVFALTGCSNNENKNLTPEERFKAVVDNYNKKIEENDLTKLLTQLPNGGSLAVTIESQEPEMDIPMNTVSQGGTLNLKVYLNKNQTSAQIDFESGETKLNLSAGIDGTKVILATDLLDTAYGVDLSQVKDKFPTSIFGTKGSNLLGLTEEDEKELLDGIEEILSAYKKLETPANTETKSLIDMFLARATLTEDKDTPYVVDGESLSNVTLTAKLTKEGLIHLVEDVIAETKTAEDVKKLLDMYNSENGTNYQSVSEVLGEALSDFAADAAIVSVKLILNEEKNLPYAVDVKLGENSGILAVFGKDVENPSKINVTVNEDGTTSKFTVINEKAVDKHTLTITEDDSKEGVSIVISKFDKTLSLYHIEDGNLIEDDALTFGFELTAELMTLTAEQDGAKISITIKAKDTSPIKFDDYKDILTLTEEELIELSEKLETIFPSEPEEDWEDEWDDEWEDDIVIDDTTETL